MIKTASGSVKLDHHGRQRRLHVLNDQPSLHRGGADALPCGSGNRADPEGRAESGRLQVDL